MKLLDILHPFTRDGETVAYFGDAKLIRHVDCQFELRGGSDEDRAQAREWISLFMHEAILK